MYTRGLFVYLSDNQIDKFKMKTTRVVDFFEPLHDHRRPSGNKQHELLDIIESYLLKIWGF